MTKKTIQTCHNCVFKHSFCLGTQFLPWPLHAPPPEYQMVGPLAHAVGLCDRSSRKTNSWTKCRKTNSWTKGLVNAYLRVF